MTKKIWPATLIILLIAVCSTAYSSEKMRVLNPTPPNRMVDRVPLTPRLDTLEGKTIFLVDIGWGGPQAAPSIYAGNESLVCPEYAERESRDPKYQRLLHAGPAGTLEGNIRKGRRGHVRDIRLRQLHIGREPKLQNTGTELQYSHRRGRGIQYHQIRPGTRFRVYQRIAHSIYILSFPGGRATSIGPP